MTATRSRKEELQYKKYRKTLPEDDYCGFCHIKKGDEQFIKSTRNFKIIRNIFGYSMWDSQKVEDHLMVVPLKHIDSLSGLSDKAALEFAKLIFSYEEKGYNVYARAPGSKLKSVIHQHTHLIKPKGKQKKLVLYVRKPYIRASI